MKRNSDKISVYFQAFYFIIYFPSDSSLKCTSTAASSIEDGTISDWLTVESIYRKKASKTVEPHVIMNWVSKSICRTFSTRNRNISSIDLYPFQSEKCVKILEMKHLNCRTPISWLFISLSLSMSVCACLRICIRVTWNACFKEPEPNIHMIYLQRRIEMFWIGVVESRSIIENKVPAFPH